MTLAVAVLAGTGAGLGLCLLVAGLRPAPATISSRLARLDQALPPDPRRAVRPARPETTADSVRRWLALRAAGPARGAHTGDLDADLAVTATPAELHAGAKVLSGLVGFAGPAVLATLLDLLGRGLPLLVPLWVCLSGAAVGYLLPDVQLRSSAADARRMFRASIGAYLDLVAMRMASGSGLAEALQDAARIGAGPAFAQIRGALADARTDGLTPAEALGRLGQQLQLPDLVDTSTRLRLVDASGAQAQASLRAQAASLRDRELAEAQGRANEQSQSMLVAQVVLGLGFVLFLGYPAVVRVLAT